VSPLDTILIVEDDAQLRDLLADHLEEQGYTVRAAADGHEALAILERDRPPVILLDLRLPGVHGLQLLQRIRQDHPTIRVIVVSGVEDEILARSTLRQGAFDYVRKPFRLDRLDAVVLAALVEPGRETRAGS
jgi:DNA-binding NtrC family response regulator